MSTITTRIRTLLAPLATMQANNEILKEGEFWTEKDPDTGRSTGRRKMGDGVTAFNDLPFEPTAGDTNLTIVNRTATTLDIASSTGADATVPAATTSQAGLLSSSDKTKVDASASIGLAAGLAIALS